MNIAVIGDYGSPEYRDLLIKVAIMQPEEKIFDLSVHNKGTWKEMLQARLVDIGNAHMVIICDDWHSHFDAKRDITHAQSLRKELFIECDGKFIPFSAQTDRS